MLVGSRRPYHAVDEQCYWVVPHLKNPFRRTSFFQNALALSLHASASEIVHAHTNELTLQPWDRCDEVVTCLLSITRWLDDDVRGIFRV